MSIIEHCIAAYKFWHQIKIHIQKVSRYTLGEKIDALFIETLELLFIAQYLPRTKKLPILYKANTTFDTLKFFTKILWELKNLEDKSYVLFSEKLHAIGIMLNKWINYLEADIARGGETARKASANMKK